MSYIIVTKNNQEPVSENFTQNEFHSKSSDAPNSHQVNTSIINAAQALRDFWGVPVNITSTHRTLIGNAAVGGVTNSQHRGWGAVDLQPSNSAIRPEKLTAFYEQMACKGPLYQQLKGFGIMGFGFYDSFLHLDDGTYSVAPRTVRTFWDNSSGNYGPTALTTSFMNSIPEDGNPECGDLGYTPSEATVTQYSQKKKTLIDQLFDWNGEDGIAWNSVQKVALVFSGVVLYVFLRERWKKWKM